MGLNETYQVYFFLFTFLNVAARKLDTRLALYFCCQCCSDEPILHMSAHKYMLLEQDHSAFYFTTQITYLLIYHWNISMTIDIFLRNYL